MWLPENVKLYMWLALDNGALVERDKYQSGKTYLFYICPWLVPLFLKLQN